MGQCTIIFCCVKSMDEKSEETTNEIREELVVTAVKFLQNSKVVGSSLETKKSFLLNKGLTAKEIEAAFHRLSSTSVQYGSSPSDWRLLIWGQIYMEEIHTRVVVWASQERKEY